MLWCTNRNVQFSRHRIVRSAARGGGKCERILHRKSDAVLVLHLAVDDEPQARDPNSGVDQQEGDVVRGVEIIPCRETVRGYRHLRGKQGGVVNSSSAVVPEKLNNVLRTVGQLPELGMMIDQCTGYLIETSISTLTEPPKGCRRPR